MSLTPINSKGIFESIAAQIRDLIETEEMVPGDKLPNERDLAAQLGVSRHAVREALRTMEVTGWVTMRKGATGGAFVSSGRPEVLTEIVERLMQSRELTVDQLTEARLIVELAIIDALKGRISDALLETLENNVHEAERLTNEGRDAEKTAMNIRFHALLAEGSGNLILVIVTDALMSVLRRLVEELGSVMGHEVIRTRWIFLEHLRENELPGARSEMERHLKSLHRYYVEAAAKKEKTQKRRANRA
ncbi:MAG: GntR family transcriptional regulator [Pseudomonadota bacterium]|nr:GntR family transcriptional regulator [Pseudomonadota bacterium]MEE2859666.1 GntR family transcriptional regulator [Pseudomonadota bacterium]